MTIRICRYQDSDHEQVLRLHRVALAAVGADVGPGPWDDDLDQIPQTYLSARGEFLVGLLDDQVAAMGALRQVDQKTAEMPHGGFGHSGYGKDLSVYGFEDYTRLKHVMSNISS
jgi:hypothetical protein